MKTLEFLKNKKEMCETAIAHSQERIKSMREELTVINEMILRLKGGRTMPAPPSNLNILLCEVCQYFCFES